MPIHRKVLIVDDDRDARELFTFVLEDAGATVALAEDGVTGLRAALERQPDLVLTDIAMPRMDGINMVRRLREQECTRTIPVVAITGHVVADLPERAREAGCAEVVPKPCSPDDLVDIVNRYIGRRASDRGPDGPAGSDPSPIDRRRHD
jgi:two-component system, cell cycle response regulator DivK